MTVLQRKLRRLMLLQALGVLGSTVLALGTVVGAMFGVGLNATLLGKLVPIVGTSPTLPVWLVPLGCTANALVLLVSSLEAACRTAGELPGNRWQRWTRVVRDPELWMKHALNLDDVNTVLTERFTVRRAALGLLYANGLLAVMALMVLALTVGLTRLRRRSVWAGRGLPGAMVPPGQVRRAIVPTLLKRWQDRLLAEHPELVVQAEQEELRRAIATDPQRLASGSDANGPAGTHGTVGGRRRL